MAHLEISLFGPIQVKLEGQPVTGFKSNKVRALLAYLAVEADKPHRRETLAGLLWPDWPEREALGNLRYTLSDLRRAIDDRAARVPYLIISRDSIQLNTASDLWLDVAAFTEGLKNKSASMEEQEKTLNLYKGEFLEGFSLDDSPAFDDWTLLTREKLARQALTSLHALADSYEERKEYEKVQSLAWRQLELELWDESAHQQLMRVMAYSGQRSAALAQYESCRKILDEELGVEPSEETRELYGQIRDGILKTSKPAPIPLAVTTRVSSFLETEPPRVETPIVVARESELEKMNRLLEQALAGQGGVVFVTGEAGSGKTSLIQEFTQRAQEADKTLIVASGNCNAYTGIGDPYLPFREILELLTGNVEARWAAGTITKDHALRLWNKLPTAVSALVGTGPELIDTFVQRTALLERARINAPGRADWLINLEKLLERKPTTATAMHQVDLFEQYTRVLQTLEQASPLLLVLDDLQWADAGSINLLFHLGRRIKNNRILILGAFRSEEITLGRDGGRHPLEPVINEFRREFGDILVNVDQVEGRKFIEAFLNSEPHRLGPSFREMLYHQTQGHPLFTIELLRGLQERGDIIRDPQGYWIEGPYLDWVTLPVRVEAAIQERIRRLPETLQKALAVASVEGELFTAEVVAQVRSVDKQEMLEYLSSELDKKHRLVHAQSIQRVDGKSLFRYRFRHILFQKYLYSTLDEVERAHLHEKVGTALEELYGDQVEDAANPVHLALHFEKAQIVGKAIHYLHNAGERAVHLSAYREGITHLTKGLNLLEQLPDSAKRDHQEIDLLLALGIASQGLLGAQPDEIVNTYTKAHKLCERAGNTTQMVRALGGLAVLYYVRGEHHRAKELASEGLALAEKANEPLLLLLCHWFLGFIDFCFGNHVHALKHLRCVLDVYEPGQYHHSLVYLRGSDAGLGAMAYEVCCLWALGYPDQALKRSEEALSLAHELGHPFTLADVLCFAGCLFHAMRKDEKSLQRNAEELMRLSQERSLIGWFATGSRSQGEAFALQGKVQKGVKQAREGMEAMRTEKMLIYHSGTFAILAEVQLKAGNLDEALANLDEAFAFVKKTDERYWEAELYRIKGEVLFKQGDDACAETNFIKAIDISRMQSARSLELRAVMSLCRFWKKQGRMEEAHQTLTEIFNWFIEGFDTPDLVAAKKLLEELAGQKVS
jgi:DNA-binding SARP family transcriptional activator/predicted ATPase